MIHRVMTEHLHLIYWLHFKLNLGIDSERLNICNIKINEHSVSKPWYSTGCGACPLRMKTLYLQAVGLKSKGWVLAGDCYSQVFAAYYLWVRLRWFGMQLHACLIQDDAAKFWL